MMGLTAARPMREAWRSWVPRAALFRRQLQIGSGRQGWRASFFCLALLVFSVPSAIAGTESASFADDPKVAAFIDAMQAQHRFDAALLRSYFERSRRNETVLAAIAASAPSSDRAPSWRTYRQHAVSRSKIAAGRRFLKTYRAILSKVQTAYGVPPEIIAAILGIETGYGKNLGRFMAFEALSTLAFSDSPRAPFFKGELEQLLLLSREMGVSPTSYQSSFAGAIGIPQFLPSSYRRDAADFSGDRRIDLVGNMPDAIGSVARFLSRHGWQTGEPIARPVTVTKDPAPLLAAGLFPTLPTRDMEKNGILPAGKPLPPRQYALIALTGEGQPSEYWAGFDNFYVITRYNRSVFYAMSVFQLSEAFSARKRQDARIEKKSGPAQPRLDG